MSNMFLLSSLLGVAILSGVAGCGSKNQPHSSMSVEERMAQIVARGAGVHEVQNDVNGNLESCIAVGQARIIPHTTQTRNLAVSLARQAAIWKAYEQFASWMKANVSVSEDDQSQKESVNGSVSGARILHIALDEKLFTATVVIGWKSSPFGLQSPEQAVVRSETVVTTVSTGNERMLDRIWINDVLVIEDDLTTFKKGASESAELIYRQWDSIGRKKVDLVTKGIDDGTRLETSGDIWDDGGNRIPVDVRD